MKYQDVGFYGGVMGSGEIVGRAVMKF